MKPYLLGIDIGTSACKVAVFNRNGEVLSQAEWKLFGILSQTGLGRTKSGGVVGCSVLGGERGLQKGEISSSQIAGVGIDGQSWSAIAVDKDGNVLTNTPIWSDTRATDICKELREKIGENAIFELCGNSLQPSYTTAKILWYKQNMSEVYEKTYKILQSNSYIAYKLTGKMTQDLSQGYGLHCFDMHSGTWNEEMCEKFGISMDILP